ncbi:universal stress protein [Hymenobacter sp.]|uniref:universal stress protein n=1 Tax=Hymenobacter sp. TaxID=1898978 RepID=UPI00286BB1B0|nr:universal stress protein [Hymenobacter sp.]
MKNLLVPTDFSPESHHAFEVALQLARRVGGSVTLLHVLEVPETANFSTYGGPVGGTELPNSGGGMDGVFMIQLLQATKRRMHGLLSEASRTAPNVAVRDMVLTDRTGPAILQAIETQGIDLVVIGAQVHSAVEHLLNGSHTEELVRLAPCPVLTVKYAVAEFAPRRILFPSDFTAETDRAVAGLRQVQALFPDAELHLLQVVEEEQQAAAAQAHITAFAQRHGLQHAQPAVFTDDSPVSGISAYARQVQADLLVIPTHGRTGLSRFLHTSIAETVATHAFPPVFTFKLA